MVVDPDGAEAWVEQIGLEQKSGHYAKYGVRFVVRAQTSAISGPGFRAAVQIQKGEGDDKFPYKIVFQALGTEPKRRAIELQHGKAGSEEHIWIEPGHHIAHFTSTGNKFVLRDHERKPVLRVTIWDNKNDEL